MDALKTNKSKMTDSNSQRILSCAHQAIQIEQDAVQNLGKKLGVPFVKAVQLLLNIKGRVVVSGMGKSGHVGRKISATLASTGTPSLFMHSAEASHGDLGMITSMDTLIAVSNSGETEELTAILPVIKRLGVPLIAMTGNSQSTLAKYADIVLDTGVEKEACPLNLAPTASTTVQMVLGDALAMALLDARGFKAEDFARSHPGGTLGRRLLTHVKDVMRSLENTPHVLPQASFAQVMLQMTKKGLGMTAVTDKQYHVKGIFTDGDLRRLLEKLNSTARLDELKACDIMTANPQTVHENALAVQVARMMEKKAISQVLVVDDQNQLIGVVNTHDLMRAKVI